MFFSLTATAFITESYGVQSPWRKTSLVMYSAISRLILLKDSLPETTTVVECPAYE